MKLGIVGLPNVGKSTLFNALTNAGAPSENYPFCTVDPNIGIVSVPDKRLDVLAKMYNPEKITPATVEFVDIAGLVKGASHGEGLGNKFLSHIREVDAVVHVVRCFEDENISHVDGSIDPIRDMKTVNMELIFSDIELTERRLERIKKDKSLSAEAEVLNIVLKKLYDGVFARRAGLSPDETEVIKNMSLLTMKPVIYVANTGEEDAGNPDNNHFFAAVRDYAASEGSEAIAICAGIEAEIAELDDEDKSMFLEELGIDESGFERFIKSSYSLLGLISFLTAGSKEVRAWTIADGTKAPAAAGKIHSDFERGFIRAEVVSYDDLVRLGGMNAAKEAGLVRSEGKEYVVRDGDIVLFRFNV